MIIHAAGPKGDYLLETRVDYDPATSPLLTKEVHVACIKRELSKIQLAAILYQTPIRNKDPELGCQKWVGNALQILVEAGCIEREKYERGIEGMAEVILEAKDEQKYPSRSLPAHNGLMSREFVIIHDGEDILRAILPIFIVTRSLKELDVVPMLGIPASIFPIEQRRYLAFFHRDVVLCNVAM